MSLIDSITVRLKRVFFLPLLSAYYSFRARITASQRGLNVPLIVDIARGRAYFTLFSGLSIQKTRPTTAQAYQSWIAERQKTSPLLLKKDVETLEDGKATINWVARKSSADIVILLFHGGGYVQPCSEDIFHWVHDMVEQLQAAGLNASGAVLGYSLNPVQYPHQLGQASLALNHLLATGYSPQQIIVGGDSAGGHLTHSLLSHILHPRPGITPVTLSAPLAGSFMISPVITADTSADSYSRNQHVDFLSPSIMQGAFDGTQGGIFPTDIMEEERAAHQGWAEPLWTDDAWFSNLPSVARRVLITGGKNEVLIDSIVDFSERLRSVAGLNLDVYLDDRETHDVAPQEFGPGGTPGPTAQKLREWLVNIGRSVDLRQAEMN